MVGLARERPVFRAIFADGRAVSGQNSRGS